MATDTNQPNKEVPDPQAAQRVARLLRQEFGSTAQDVCEGAGSAFKVTLGEEHVFVDVITRSPAASVVSVNSVVVTGVEPSAEIMRYLLDVNRSMVFGAFGASPAEGQWIPEGYQHGDTLMVVFDHGLLAESVSRKQLFESVCAAEFMARELGRKIVATFGGLRPHDRLALKAL